MQVQNSPSHQLLLMMLEVLGISAKPRKESSLSPTSRLMIYTVLLLSLQIMHVSCGVGALYDEEHSLEVVPVLLVSSQLLVSFVLMIWNRKNIRATVEMSLQVLETLSSDQNNLEPIQIAGERARRFCKWYTALMFSNMAMSNVQAALKTHFSGEPNHPLALSCIGLSPVPCSLAHNACLFSVVWYFSAYYSTLEALMSQVAAYTTILARFLKQRPTDDETADQKNFKLYSDLSNFSASLSRSFGITAFVEISFSSIRSCFQSYQIITAMSEKDYLNVSMHMIVLLTSFFLTHLTCRVGDELSDLNVVIEKAVLESRWYEGPPAARKRLMPLLILINSPIKYHYKRFMLFNRDTLGQNAYITGAPGNLLALNRTGKLHMRPILTNYSATNVLDAFVELGFH